MNKLTLTIGIPAYNEEKNISRLLHSLLHQKQSSFTLEKILVAIDGSTDHTKEKVLELKSKYPVIQLIDDGLRIGKVGRLNNFYKLANTDIYMTIDGDITITDTFFLEKIAACFLDLNIQLVGSNTLPLKPSH